MLAHDARGLAGVDEVVDDQHALALAAHRATSAPTPLSTVELALVRVVVIAGDADRLDQADVEFARDDRRRHQAAAGDADDRLERPRLVQPPGQRARVAVELVPGHRERSFPGAAGVCIACHLSDVLAARRCASCGLHRAPASLRPRLSACRELLRHRASARRYWCCGPSVSSKNG